MKVNPHTTVIFLIKMAKIALLLLFGCVSFGLLKMVSTDESHLEEKDGVNLDIHEEIERSGVLHEETKKDSEDQKNRAGVQSNAMASSLVNSKPLTSLSPFETVECYACTNCQNVKPNTPTKMCPYTFDSHKQHRCVVYAEQYKHMKTPWYIRGCASERGSCDDIRKAHATHGDIVSLLHCHECEGDRCNKNSANTFSDFTMAFFAMVVTPVIAKYTLS